MTTIKAPDFNMLEWFIEDSNGKMKMREDTPADIRDKIKAYQKSVGPALSKKLEL